MGVVTRRPDTTAASSSGNWAKTPSSGATAAQILSDDSDLTFLASTTQSANPADKIVFDIANLTTADIPDGSKIKNVTIRAKLLQVAPSGGSSFLTDIIRFSTEIVEEIFDAIDDGLGDFISNIFSWLFHFPVPKPPGGASATWQTVTVVSYPNRPSGGEWTLDTLNDMVWRVGRSDVSGIQAKISEFYVDTEYNQRPAVDILGPTETRVFTDAATTNADATLTSATAAFTSDDIGASISGTGIPVGTTILSINSATSVEMSANATATATGVTATLTRAVISTTTRPIFTASYTDPEGDPQDGTRWRIFTADQVSAPNFQLEATSTSPATVPFAHSPGINDWLPGSSTQWLCNRDLPNGDYVAYAQVKQKWDVPNSEHTSQWDAYNFTIHVEGPAQPTLVATPVSTPTINSVQLDATVSDNDPAVETYNFYSSDDSGITWQLLWGGWQRLADANGAATMVDYLAPLNQTRYYKTVGYRTLNGIKVASDESVWATAIPTHNEFWLKDPFAPSLNQPIGWMDDDPGEDRDQGVHYPLVANGAKAYAIVVDGPLHGLVGDSKLLFIDPTDGTWQKWKAIRAANHTLLLQFPTGEQHWVRLKGNAKWSWHTDGGTGVDFRVLEWGYIEVQAPKDPSAPSTVQGVQ